MDDTKTRVIIHYYFGVLYCFLFNYLAYVLVVRVGHNIKADRKKTAKTVVGEDLKVLEIEHEYTSTLNRHGDNGSKQPEISQKKK